MAPSRRYPVRPAGWWFDGLLLVAAVGLTVALANGLLLEVDLAVRDWAEGHYLTGAYWVARALNYLGQGGQVLQPVAIVLAVLVAWRTRSVRPVLVFVAAYILVYGTVGPAKLLLDRGYPRNRELAHPEQLFSDPAHGLAYPSGHVVNAVVWYWVIVLLLTALLRTAGRSLPASAGYSLRIIPAGIVFVTTIYVNHHWLTDSISGLLVGLLLYRLLARVPWDDMPLPALPYGLERHGVFTSQP